MPLYEYKCEKCGEVFEVMQKFSDKPLIAHEKCGGEVHRLLSAPALQFKGSGWYVNDYAKGKTGDNGGSKKTDSSTPAAPAASDSGSAPTSKTSSSATETKSSSSSTDSKS